MTDPFDKPASMVGIDFKEHVGRLVIFDVHGIEKDITTQHGLTDAVRADITVLDGPQAGTRLIDTLVFPRVLQGQLRSRVGKKVLGRIGQAPAQAGKNPAWQLLEATEADTAIGKAHLAGAVHAPASVGAGQPPF